MKRVSIGLLALSAAIGLSGCRQGVLSKRAAAFDIPKSLMTRMLDARDRVRDVRFGVTGDVNELYALGAYFQMTNAEAVSKRPRGEMALTDDKLTDAEREALWPFDVAAFEADLESKMVYDAASGFLGRREFVEASWGGTNAAGYAAVNPTIRWANCEIEAWAIEQLNENCLRMAETNFCAMSGDEQMPEGTFAWQMDEDAYFVIHRGNGVCHPREYLYILWNGTNDPYFVATFDSFPNRLEASAMIRMRESPEAENNLAVLMWRHQCERLMINPFRIRAMLEHAAQSGVDEARRNLDVLRAHFPEAWTGD